MSQGFYELLGVEPNVTPDRIRLAYQVRLAKLVRRLRTARQKGADVTLLEAQERTLREAREVLSSPTRRRRYDAYRTSMDDGLPETAGALWKHVQASLVAPEVSLALATVQALTDLPLGQPVPPPPKPVRVQRAEAEPALATPVVGPPMLPHVPGLDAQRGPDRPTLVPATDPGIEISLSDEELAWLEQPARPAPLSPHGIDLPPNVTALSSEQERRPTDLTRRPPMGEPTFPVSDPSLRTPPATWSEDADTGDVWLDDGTDPHGALSRDVAEAEVEEDPSLPGLGFLSRLSLPKAPAWGRSQKSPPAPPDPDPQYDELDSLDPLETARRRHGATGPYMQAVREDRGMSLDELSKSTRISSRYLEAIEADAFDRLPSATFVKGYVRQIVEQLDLDGHGVVEAFMAAYRSQRG